MRLLGRARFIVVLFMILSIVSMAQSQTMDRIRPVLYLETSQLGLVQAFSEDGLTTWFEECHFTFENSTLTDLDDCHQVGEPIPALEGSLEIFNQSFSENLKGIIQNRAAKEIRSDRILAGVLASAASLLIFVDIRHPLMPPGARAWYRTPIAITLGLIAYLFIDNAKDQSRTLKNLSIEEALLKANKVAHQDPNAPNTPKSIDRKIGLNAKLLYTSVKSALEITTHQQNSL